MDINKINSALAPKISKTNGFFEGEEQKTNDPAYKQFGEIFKSAFETLEETQAQTQKDSYEMAMGNFDNLHQIMINSEKAATALELTTQVTSRAVSAYNEIMHMQI